MQHGELRQDWRRLRWRLRGAWQWPTFLTLTVVDAVVLALLPFYDDGPGGLFPALLLAGFANLLLVAVVAPLAGRIVRRVRRDLPRVVARDYAGTILLVGLTALLVGGGLAHRPAVAQAEADRAAVLLAVHDYVLDRAPALRDQIGYADATELEPKLYRACVPKHRAGRFLCLIVSTDQRPPGITLDHSEDPFPMR
jgi:hypothetical protein